MKNSNLFDCTEWHIVSGGGPEDQHILVKREYSSNKIVYHFYFEDGYNLFFDEIEKKTELTLYGGEEGDFYTYQEGPQYVFYLHGSRVMVIPVSKFPDFLQVVFEGLGVFHVRDT